MSDRYKDAPELLKKAVQKWIELVLQPAEKVCPYTTYNLKHHFEASYIGWSPVWANLYMTEDRFREAMSVAGYQEVDPTEKHGRYYITSRSPLRARGFHPEEHHSECARAWTNYCLCHLPPKEKQAYEEIVAALGRYQREK